MNTVVKRISGAEAAELAYEHITTDNFALALTQVAAENSDPAVSVWLGDMLLALGGFIPLGILTGTAFVWMNHTPAAAHHPTAIIRTGRQVLAVARSRYPRVIGNCSLGPRSEAWLTSLGAKFVSAAGVTKHFVIED